MPKIAIIDDKKDYRISLKRIMRPYIRGTAWEVEDIAPFQNPNDYQQWIVNEEIAAIILDEKLKESTEETNVDYEGHNLVEYLRIIFPDFPIFILTALIDRGDLEGTESEVEEILQKEKLLEKKDILFPRILRAAQRFSDAYERDLSDMTVISQKIIKGEATDEEIEKLNAIRKKLSLVDNESALNPQNKWITEFDSVVTELETVKTDINNYLEKKNNEVA